MGKKVVIIDYGMGNLGSISNMLKFIGADSIITSDHNIIESAEKIILPGVGHFDRAMNNINELNLVEILRKKSLVDKVPFLGICLGMQCAVIEFARNVLGLKDAHTTEIAEDSKNPVISMMEEQKSISNMGGTMRLGSYKCELKPNSFTANAYHTEKINERHRHRYEFNNDYLEQYEKAGMIATGKNPDTGLVEVVEIPEHPWFVGAQYHPEYKSTVAKPHPLFVAFIKASLENKK